LKNVMPTTVTYPNTGHVTLRGFSEPDILSKLQGCTEKWALKLPPISVDVEGISYFDAPYKVVFLKIRSTDELKKAYSSLSKVVVNDNLQTIDVQRDENEWIFHMSLAYCADTNDDEWQQIIDITKNFKIEKVNCIVDNVELVEYKNGEHRLVYRLGG
jgi:2'-5' RNA ligase